MKIGRQILLILISVVFGILIANYVNVPWLDYLNLLIHWIARLLEMLFPWPIVVIFALLLVFWTKDIRDIFGGILLSIKKLKIYNVELELSAEGKRKVEYAINDVKDVLEVYRNKMNSEINRSVDVHDLYKSLSDIVDTVVRENVKNKKLPENFRSTVYIPDFLFKDHLFQLLDYNPYGGGAGRVLSVRYGIVGKVWRSNISMTTGSLIDRDGAPEEGEEQIKEISRDWGLARHEARRVAKRPSYSCVYLSKNSDSVGLLYMDSTEKNAFGEGKEQCEKFQDILRESMEIKNLIDKIQLIKGKLEDVSPRISLIDQ